MKRLDTLPADTLQADILPAALPIEDVRHEMPNYEARASWHRAAKITGIAIHHSAILHNIWGQSFDTAHSLFQLHVTENGWDHGGYHYVILPNGTIQYALDEGIAAWHAGFKDPEDSLGLEQGQYWNNHYLAICLPGWFSSGRWAKIWEPLIQRHIPILNFHTQPSRAQRHSLLQLLQHLMAKHAIAPEHVQGHRELAGCRTQCPGDNFDIAQLRRQLANAQQGVE